MPSRHSARRRGTILAFLALATVACASEPDGTMDTTAAGAPGAVAAGDPEERGTAFLRELATLCGQRFPGRATVTPTSDDVMAGAALSMEVAECGEREMRIPFVVDSNRSRTWELTLGDSGLLLKHDHRHADGTPDSVTNYGGWARAGGSVARQDFPADSFTAQLIPAAATNVWTLELDRAAQRFVYALSRNGQPRYRAEFDLSAGEPLP